MPSVIRSRKFSTWSVAVSASAVLALALAGCASTSQDVTGAKDAVIVVSQEGKSDSGKNPKVNVPFYVTGSNFDASATVKLRFYAGTDTKASGCLTRTCRALPKAQ